MKSALLALALSCSIFASEVPIKELESGTSRNIQYSILRESGNLDDIIVRFYNRTGEDIRIRYTIIPGAGDVGEIGRTAIVQKDSSYPMHGSGKIKCSFRFPGIRITEVEFGQIIEEETVFYDEDGNEKYSKLMRFIPKKVR